MDDRIQIINYLPSFVASYKEIEKIMEDNQQELDPLWEIHRQVLDNNFVLDSDENGVSRYEKLLDILKKPGQSLDDRKFAILLAMNKELPYTIRTLRNMLTSALGDENAYSLSVKHNDYVLLFMLKAKHQKKLEEIVRTLREIVPANLGIASTLTMLQTAAIYTAAHTATATHIVIAPYMPPPLELSGNVGYSGFVKAGGYIKIY